MLNSRVTSTATESGSRGPYVRNCRILQQLQSTLQEAPFWERRVDSARRRVDGGGAGKHQGDGGCGRRWGCGVEYFPQRNLSKSVYFCVRRDLRFSWPIKPAAIAECLVFWTAASDDSTWQTQVWPWWKMSRTSSAAAAAQREGERERERERETQAV